MKALTRNLLAVAIVAGTAFAASVASAATIEVTLWDKGANTPMGTGMMYATPGLDLSAATMGIKAAPATTPQGTVTFHVTNSSSDTVHEMIVMYMADPTQALPYIDAENRVDEDKAGDKGEVSELDPGASGSLTVDLKPGKYLLICNVPGHYGAGMWTEFEVTK